MVHAVNGTFALRGGGIAEDTSGLTGRGRHHKRYSDNATLRFALLHNVLYLRRIVIASIVIASESYRSEFASQRYRYRLSL
jgi:hypothetical protein